MENTQDMNDWLFKRQEVMNEELGDLLQHLRARFLHWYDAPYKNTFGSRSKALFQYNIPAYVTIRYVKKWLLSDCPPTDEEWSELFSGYVNRSA